MLASERSELIRVLEELRYENCSPYIDRMLVSALNFYERAKPIEAKRGENA